MTKAVFELEMDDDFYQHLLEEIEKLGYYYLPVGKGIRVSKIDYDN